MVPNWHTSDLTSVKSLELSQFRVRTQMQESRSHQQKVTFISPKVQTNLTGVHNKQRNNTGAKINRKINRMIAKTG